MKRLNSLGIIGAGNMGAAIARRVVNAKLIPASRVNVYDVDAHKPRRLAREFGVCWARGPEGFAKSSRVVLLAVKPQDLPEIARVFRPLLGPRPQIISILAGISIRVLRRYWGSTARVVRCMPNLALTVGEAVTAVTGDAQVLPIAKSIFEVCGSVFVAQEKYFHAITALSGSGPAYYFHLMELTEREARRYGLSRPHARLIASGTARGASLLAVSSGLDPRELREKVTSKGGTTEAALDVLFKNRWPTLFSKAVRAAVRRGQALERGQ